jgi:uncharacterized protein (DUF305 family)
MSSGSGSTGSGSGTTGSGSGTTGSGTSGTMGSGSGSTGMQNGMSGMNDMSGMGHMAGMDALQNASGTEFNRLFVTQMLTMHQAKLSELQTASTQLKDAELKTIVRKAIPKVRMHRDALLKMNK